ncbi:ABC transporter permease [Streptantibioticus ferralitis]|uniref:Transport permease protein n=1 Tax=Streptantibioticus ferralitis TaxID=236510 RepID=A0ABT5YX46_9ACTN|nr:ABC transporter permease [Streptantibioticus ferralitis]MDF2256177.1 ABC transporter permease [Streptantibioticus ferralitis]
MSAPTTDRVIQAAAPSGTTVHALRKLTITEGRLFLRDPAAAFFTLAFPVLLLAILGSVPAFRKATPKLHGLSTIEVYAPVMVIFTLVMLATNGITPVLTAYREKGILRRLSASPAPAAMILGALVTLYAIVAVVSLLLVAVVGRLAFHIALPQAPLAFLVALVMSAASLFAVGLLLAALAPSAKAGNAIGVASFFPMMFFSGLWVPRDLMPGTLRRIGDFIPSGAATQAVLDAWHGSWPHAGDLTKMAVFALVAGCAAAKLFRWE